MLTHKNLTTAAIRVKTHIEGTTDTVLLFLPMAHSFARICHQSAAYHGATLALCADATRVPEALARVRPTILPAVPRVYEKVHANALGEIERAGGAKRAIGRWALRIGSRASALRRSGRSVPAPLRVQLALADKLVFSKVRDRLGGRLRLGVSGAAPLSVEVLEFFHSLNMLVIEGYGLTETSSSLSVNDPDDYRFGTVGHAVEGCEVRLDSDGEILVRSDTIFDGYFKDPEATAAAFTEDGWFRTGDVGELDADGWLKITDRKKDLIITAGGKNIAPQNLENALEGVALRLAGTHHRRPPAVRDRPDHPRSSGARRRRTRPAGARAGDRRRRQPRPGACRADQALRDPAARLLAGRGRADADPEAAPQDRARALRGRDRTALYLDGAR